MVVVVDDDQDTCKAMERLLTNRGLPTKCITSPIQALRELKRVKPAVVLLDVMMPEMNGVELLRQIRTDPSTADIPVVMITATTDEDDLEEAKRLGAIEILTKSRFDWAKLPERVREYIRSSPSN
jgi:CheY-like chemotaxis protein